PRGPNSFAVASQRVYSCAVNTTTFRRAHWATVFCALDSPQSTEVPMADGLKTSNLYRNQSQLAASYQKARFQFIMTELDLGITFCRLALSTKSNEAAVRNANNAMRAYDSAERYFVATEMGQDREGHVTARRQRLTELIEQVLEKISLLRGS